MILYSTVPNCICVRQYSTVVLYIAMMQYSTVPWRSLQESWHTNVRFRRWYGTAQTRVVARILRRKMLYDKITENEKFSGKWTARHGAIETIIELSLEKITGFV